VSHLTADPSVALSSAHAAIGRAFRVSLALALAAVAVWFAVRNVLWGSVANTLRESDLLLLGLAFCTVLATTAVKAVRWRILLGPCGARVTGVKILRVLFIGQVGNSLLPARLGDAARAVLIGPQVDGGVAGALGTVAAEKALDGAMGLFVLIALAVGTPLPTWLQRPALVLALTTLCLLVFLALIAGGETRASALFRHATRWLRPSCRERMVGALAGFRGGLGLLQRPSIALGALACSVAVWCLAGLTNYLTMVALGIQAPFWSVPLVLVAGYVVNFLPAVPTQIGVFEYTCILALKAVGVRQEPALAFGLILHVLIYAPPLLLGPFAMAIEGLNWNRLWKTRKECVERHCGVE
jgi:uncharacterized protein (TIRG00374 family)